MQVSRGKSIGVMVQVHSRLQMGCEEERQQQFLVALRQQDPINLHLLLDALQTEKGSHAHSEDFR